MSKKLRIALFWVHVVAYGSGCLLEWTTAYLGSGYGYNAQLGLIIYLVVAVAPAWLSSLPLLLLIDGAVKVRPSLGSRLYRAFALLLPAGWLTYICWGSSEPESIVIESLYGISVMGPLVLTMLCGGISMAKERWRPDQRRVGSDLRRPSR